MSIGNKLAVAKTVMTSKAGLALLKTQKHSPTILFGIGVIGVVGATVLACKATLHLEEDVLDPIDDEREAAEEALADADVAYSEKQYNSDLKKLKFKLALGITRQYAPAIVVGGLAVAALAGSHVILTRRNANLMAAYIALDKSYKAYRERVIEEFGEEKDRELRFGVEETEVEGPDGKMVKVKKAKGETDYARIFSRDTSNAWDPRPEHNLVFLKTVQQWCTDELRAKGVLTLNDVHDALGLDRTKAGAVVGWKYNNPRHNGDNRVDFSLLENASPEDIHAFFHGPDGSIMLDFNVDGLVHDFYQN